MTVASIMRRYFISISPADSLLEAYQVMRLARIRVAPVVMGGVLVGLLSFGDLARACLDGAGSEDSPLARLRREPVSSLLASGPALGPAQAPASLAPDTTLAVAASRLCAHELGCLPVTEASTEGLRIVGIVTEMDLLAAVFAGVPAHPA